jgi:flagellar hook assembly protein FlgD
LRRLAAAVLLALLTAAGAAGSAAAVVPISNAKVVIIVGATEGTTSTYRSYADQAYAEAIKYTSRVTKVYSPNATWSKVKAAAAGANIVLYYGHGNGWPSPYTYDPNYTTKDGFGLNDPYKLSDYVHKYYGEPYVATLGLAPNAIVLLGNLCYASGNSEPGKTAPTVSVAHQRIDNYAAGFLKGGARAVIADGHGGLVSYIRGLFTSSKTVVDMWRSVPNYHGHEVSFASSRSPGYTAYSDPDTTSGGYYRSLVTKPTITTSAVTNAAGNTGADPATLVVPGRAEAAAPGAPLYVSAPGADSAAAPILDLPGGTRLKTIAIAAPATAGTAAMIHVTGLDDPSIDGYVGADHLIPRDSRAPVVIGIDAGTARFSPNGDGRFDTQTVEALFSEPVAWTFEVKNAGGTVLASQTGSGNDVSVTWDGLVGGAAADDGTYTWTVRGTDAWQNGTATGTGSIVVDTTPPSITALSPSTSTTFTPNGDGATDTITTSATTTEAGSLAVRIANDSDTTVRTFTLTAASGANAIVWDGRNSSGSIVPDGPYTMTVVPRDSAGNGGPAARRPILVLGFLGYLTNSTKVFYPQDGDRFSKTTTLSFKLSRAATVTWTLRNAAGQVVVTDLDSVALAAGVHSWVFDGRSASGSMLPAGVYSATVSASDGTYAIASSIKVEMNAFAIAASTATPRRGSSITITAVTAETISGSVRLYVTQPGIATWGVTMTKVSSTTYRVTVKLKTGGAAGTVKFKVWGRDLDGRSQATWKSLPLG